MNLQKLRERINLKIYGSKTAVLSSFRVASILVSLIVVSALIYFHGFHISSLEKRFITELIKWGFAFYILKFIVRIFYSFEPLKDLKVKAVEGLLMLIIVLNFLCTFLFGWELIHAMGSLLGIENLSEFFMLVIQGYFVLILLNEIGKAGGILSAANLKPSVLLISSFLILIIFGTGLLMLPQMSSSGESIPLLDALFTSISASCVNGLIIVDTATYFSLKGQLVIMMLFQLGGLNIISIASLFVLFARQGIGLKHQGLIQANLNVESLSVGRSLFRQIFIFSITIEAIGAFLIFHTWEGVVFDSFLQKVYFSVFHSISAFNNAGISLFTDGLLTNGVHTSYYLHLVIAILIFLGGIGFIVLHDIFSLSKYRERKRNPWRSWRIGTKISLYSAAILIIAGFIVFLIFERNNTMEGQSAFGMFTSSLFQSITPRSGGFSTVDIGAVTTPVLIFIILLMFIGGSPGSTAGGVRTNTFALILLGAWTTAMGKERLEIFKQTISYDLLNKAFLIFLFTIGFISIAIFSLAITDPDKNLIVISFEAVSAFCTVGLSTGITPDLSTGGKIIIMICMYIGRIGTLTLAFALGSTRKSHSYKYPKANMMIG